jgi:hypothetical protein
MRTAAHFGLGGDSRYQAGGPSGTGSGNALKYGAHGGGFGAASSKPPADGEHRTIQPRATAPGDLTETALAAHLAAHIPSTTTKPALRSLPE